MESESTLDSELTDDLNTELKLDRRKYLVRIVALIVVNIVVFGQIVEGQRSSTDIFLSALKANLIGVNVLGFTLGTIVALFPYRGLPYKKRYLKASLLTILILQIIMTVGLILIGLTNAIRLF